MIRGDEPEPQEDEGRFLDRWARRKAAGEETPVAPPPVEPAPTEQEVEAIVARLPALDSIATTRDVSAFLARGVPEALRNAALDLLWRSDPAIRDRVADAIDYAENYLAPETIAGFGAAAPEAGRTLVERLHRGVETLTEAGPGPDHPGPVAAIAPQPPAEPPEAPEARLSTESAAAPRRAPRRHGGALPDSRDIAT
ncbi:MAG: DUF3306 domain-containing protein [Methylobacteriaceae bacterium]|nr:DUF3306 domain-containing protein [Methylobacteriaceae bacterium]